LWVTFKSDHFRGIPNREIHRGQPIINHRIVMWLWSMLEIAVKSEE
jgi:hypothetical protein